jgi:queuine tRNA-ribosyltransferase
MSWQKTAQQDQKRVGLLTTKSGAIKTPVFMPIATKGAVKHLFPDEVGALGAEVILGNTYHLWLRPGDDLVAKAGGLHKMMDWTGSILTDSGGFQVFSLGARAEERFGVNGVKICEEGVDFSDPTNGKKYFLSPEISIDIQLNLGSDIIMVLDECPPYPCTREYAKSSLERTTRWAKRAKEHFEMKMKDIPQEKRPLLFGIVQGSVYEDLRQDSAEQLVALDFDGYAIGGVAVGEPRETLGDVLAWTIPSLPEDKPRYLMGLGRPEEIVRAVEAGVDMFDCVIPTREGRHGRLFVEKPAHNSSGSDSGGEGPESIDSFYATINIKNEQFTEDFSPVDEMCDCVLCTRYTKSYLRHLFAVGEPLAGRLASVHNLRFYLRMMQKLRNE